MTDEQAQWLWQWLQTTSALAQKTNNELGDLVTDHLWADLPLGSPQSDLLAEVIARLKGERQQRGLSRRLQAPRREEARG